MNARETIEELIKAQQIIKNVRLKNRKAQWLCHSLKAVESLLTGICLAVEHVFRMTR